MLLSVSGVCLKQVLKSEHHCFLSLHVCLERGKHSKEMERSLTRVIAESVEWGSVTSVTPLHLYVSDQFLDCELLGDTKV